MVRFAMGLVAEDERRRVEDGDEVPFGPWLSTRAAGRIEDKVAGLVSTAADLRLHPDMTPSVFTTATSLAAHAGVERTRILDEIAPRAQLLATIAAAGFAVDGMLSPIGAYMMFADGGPAGRDAHVFGIHNVPGEAAFSRVTGVSALGYDTCVPVTAQALVAGMPQSPADVQRGREELGRWGLEFADDLAGHVVQALQVVGAARGVVATAAGSRACRDAGIDPRHLLEVGFSRWLLLGSVDIGPRRPRSIAAGQRVHPGLDAAVIRAARDEGLRPIAHAGALTVAGSLATPTNPEILLAHGSRIMHGDPLVHALLTGDRDALPGLRELSDAQLREVEEHARTLRIPCTIGAKYLVLPKGLLLTSAARPEPVGALVRIGPHASTLWTTAVDLADPRALPEVVARAELHIRSIEDHTLSRSVRTYFEDHDLHRLQAASYKAHTAMRIVTMLANLAAVGVTRAHQCSGGAPA
jgi:hypothetical protein